MILLPALPLLLLELVCVGLVVQLSPLKRFDGHALYFKVRVLCDCFLRKEGLDLIHARGPLENY